MDLDGDHPRRVLRHRGARLADRGVHLVHDEEAAVLRLLDGARHGVDADALDLHVHLHGGHAGSRAGHFEVHVTQCILDALDVAQHGDLAIAGDQAHRDAGHLRLDRDAGIHHRQAGAADARHRGGPVRGQDLGDEADGVGKFFFRRHDGQERPLGERAMADLAPPGRAQWPRLAHAEGREVVVMHEALELFEAEPVELLLVADRTERHDAQRLGLAPGKEGGPVGAGQHPDFAADGPDLGRLPTVGPHPLIEDLAAHPLLDLGLETLGEVGQPVDKLRTQLGDGFLSEVVQCRLPEGLVGVEERLVEPLRQELVHGLVDLRILGALRDVDFRLPDFAGEGILHVADPDDLAMRDSECLHDPLLGDFLGAGFDHDDGLTRAGDHQVELALVHLVDGRVHDELIVDDPHPDGSDRPLEGDRRDRQRRRGADDGHDGRVGLLVNREDGGDHLDVVTEILGEERPDRPVDQAAVQDRLLAGAALPPDESTGDLAGGVELLFVVAGEWEEVDPFPRGCCHHGGHEQHGVPHAYGDGTGCLLGHPTGFNRQGAPTEFELCLIHDSSWAALERGTKKVLAVGPGGSCQAG